MVHSRNKDQVIVAKRQSLTRMQKTSIHKNLVHRYRPICPPVQHILAGCFGLSMPALVYVQCCPPALQCLSWSGAPRPC
eukprot:4745424-Pleurochrysis_carterae.AAC.1